MLIKCKTHRYRSGIFRRLTRYIFSDRGRGNEISSFSIFHNLSSYTPDEIAEELEINHQLKHHRSNGVALYHIIMSFEPGAKQHLTKEILEDLARQFLALRRERGIAISRLHNEDGHPHLHFLISGNEYGSSKANRMSKAEFNRIHLELEAYQMAKYPELSQSIVKLGREPNLSKEKVQEIVSSTWDNSLNWNQFEAGLIKQGLMVYQRAGRPYGVQNKAGKKYRFSLLGVDDLVQDLWRENSRKKSEFDINQWLNLDL